MDNKESTFKPLGTKCYLEWEKLFLTPDTKKGYYKIEVDVSLCVNLFVAS